MFQRLRDRLLATWLVTAVVDGLFATVMSLPIVTVSTRRVAPPLGCPVAPMMS